MDRRSFPTTTDTSKLAGAVDPAAALKDLDSRNNPHSTIRVTTRFSGGELRQHQMNSNSSEPSTCPRLRAQAATFALILDQSRVNSQLIGTALISDITPGEPVRKSGNLISLKISMHFELEITRIGRLYYEGRYFIASLPKSSQ